MMLQLKPFSPPAKQKQQYTITQIIHIDTLNNTYQSSDGSGNLQELKLNNLFEGVFVKKQPS